jgi:hypothetical protein
LLKKRKGLGAKAISHGAELHQEYGQISTVPKN